MCFQSVCHPNPSPGLSPVISKKLRHPTLRLCVQEAQISLLCLQNAPNVANAVWLNITVRESGGRLLLFFCSAVTAADLRMATVMASEELAHGQITSGRSPRAWNTLRKASQEDIDPVITNTHTHTHTEPAKQIYKQTQTKWINDNLLWLQGVYRGYFIKWESAGWLTWVGSVSYDEHAQRAEADVSLVSLGQQRPVHVPRLHHRHPSCAKGTLRQRDRLHNTIAQSTPLLFSLTANHRSRNLTANSSTVWLSCQQVTQQSSDQKGDEFYSAQRAFCPRPPVGWFNWTTNQWVQQTIASIHPPLSNVHWDSKLWRETDSLWLTDSKNNDNMLAKLSLTIKQAAKAYFSK